MKKTLLVLCLLLLAGWLGAAERKHYFEPTQDLWDNPVDNERLRVDGDGNTGPGIHAQQARYKAAKAKGDYKTARAEALFNFQIAWLDCNRGEKLKIKAEKTKNTALLKEALDLLTSAVQHCKAESVCDPGNHKEEQEKCLAFAEWMRKDCQRQLAKFPENK